MSVDTTLAVLYAQSGTSTNVANAAMVGPQAALAISRVLAAEASLLERERVAKNEKSDSAKLHADGRGPGAFHSRFRARRRQQENESAQTPPTPFVGNLLNVRV